MRYLCLLALVCVSSGPAFAQPPGPPRGTICIDPGHPSEVNSGLTVQNGTTETHMDWVVALKLQKLLQDQGFQVVMTKRAEKQLVRNKERALIANRAHAGLMVRLHCDAGSDNGYAVYYPDRQGTKEGKTGPTPAIMERSRGAAQTVEQAMGKALDGALKDGGVRGDSRTLIGGKQGALTGSIFSEVPVITIEMVVLSNAQDAAFIKTEEGQARLAHAIAAGAAQYVAAGRAGK